MREYIRAQRAAGVPMASVDPGMIRGIRTDDFFGKRGGAQPQRHQQNHQQARAVEDVKARRSSGAADDDEYEDIVEDNRPVSPD
jgi:hypothetical protein